MQQHDNKWALVTRITWIVITAAVALLMLTTGTINTVAIKYQDNTKAPGSDPSNHFFHHPFMQALFMFIGEFLNMGAYAIMWIYGLIMSRVRPVPSAQSSSSSSAYPGVATENSSDSLMMMQNGEGRSGGGQVVVDGMESTPILSVYPNSNENGNGTNYDNVNDESTTAAATTTGPNQSSDSPSSKNTEKPVVKKIPGRWYHTFLFAIPALCDLTATSLMNYGLILTAASVYQMLRSAMVVFTAIFSVLFLRRRLQLHHFVGLTFIVVGTACVGAASMIWKRDDGDSSSSNPVLGDILILVAQVIVAIQWVVEEKLLAKINFQPVRAVGAEGFWGMLAVSGLLFIFYWIPGGDAGSFENAIDAFIQIKNSKTILIATIISIFSIGVLNFCAMTITSRLSATHRGTIDACRTVCVWVVSLLAGWEEFLVLQAVGFIVLVLGTFLYNKVLPLNPFSLCFKKKKPTLEGAIITQLSSDPAKDGFQSLPTDFSTEELTGSLDHAIDQNGSEDLLKQMPMSYQQTAISSI